MGTFEKRAADLVLGTSYAGCNPSAVVPRSGGDAHPLPSLIDNLRRGRTDRSFSPPPWVRAGAKCAARFAPRADCRARWNCRQ